MRPVKAEDMECGVIQDLIPLVADGVACPESERLVREHAETCEVCRAALEACSAGDTPIPVLQDVEPDDRRVLARIRGGLLAAGGLFLLAGVLLGVILTDSAGVFYNFLLMPVVGILGYLLFRGKWYLAAAGVAALSFLGVFLQGVLESGLKIWTLQNALIYAVIYTFLALLGMTIAALLCFAFRREKKGEN